MSSFTDPGTGPLFPSRGRRIRGDANGVARSENLSRVTPSPPGRDGRRPVLRGDLRYRPLSASIGHSVILKGRFLRIVRPLPDSPGCPFRFSSPYFGSTGHILVLHVQFWFYRPSCRFYKPSCWFYRLHFGSTGPHFGSAGSQPVLSAAILASWAPVLVDQAQISLSRLPRWLLPRWLRRPSAGFADPVPASQHVFPRPCPPQRQHAIRRTAWISALLERLDEANTGLLSEDHPLASASRTWASVFNRSSLLPPAQPSKT